MKIPISAKLITRDLGEQKLISFYNSTPQYIKDSYNESFAYNKIIRTSWLYDDNLNNPKFISNIFKKILSEDDINVTMQYGNPTYIPNLVNQIYKMCIEYFYELTSNGNLIEIIHDRSILSRFDIAEYVYTFLVNKGLCKPNKRINKIYDYNHYMNPHEVTKETISTGFFEDNIKIVLNSFIKQV